jgi:8-amino-7-oxononanoate synthase
MLANATHFIDEELLGLEQKGLRRVLRNIEGSQRTRLKVSGQEALNFCSNNYLGLADDRRLIEAAQKSMVVEGFGSGASRLVCGNLGSFRMLEQRLTEFKGAQKALVFSSGYMANVGIISSLFGRGDVIFSDKLNHASIVDGSLLSQAEFKRYPHLDMNALEDLLKKTTSFKRRCIITDSVFSMDGDVAPLDKIVELAKRYDCMTMIDEAHAFGVMGEHGRGAAEHFGVEKDIDIQMGTFSKAAGSFGAYVCGSEKLIDYLINKARSFIYTTGLPPSVAAASTQAIEIIKREPQRREQLWKNAKYVLSQLKQRGFDTLSSQTPIIPILVKDSSRALEFSKRLLEQGIFISAIRPPTVPVNTARLRLSIMATHTQEDLDYLLKHLSSIGKELCLI